jgi:hypothetical protein
MKLKDLFEQGNPHYGELPRSPKNPVRNMIVAMLNKLKKQKPLPVDDIAKLEKRLKDLK